jgi:hypothetical protein
MQAFLNERSLERYSDLGQALILFLKATYELSDAGGTIYRDGSYFVTADFKQRFNSTSLRLPPQEKALLRSLVFREGDWRCWRPQRVSAQSDDYRCADPSFAARDESICEASEVKLRQNADAGMVSAADSQFANKPVLRITGGSASQQVELRNNHSIESVREWIAQQRGFFDSSANEVPRDYQTILEKDTNRFRRTGRRQWVLGKSRRIYEEILTGHQYYVDHGHSGHSAHLEVFDANGQHVGPADINTGALIGERDSDKKISL